MIVGNGLIGSYFKNHASESLKTDFTIFASGVSSSLETNQSEFHREFELLKTYIGGNKIIYFSSTLVGIKDTPYYNHKSNMERFLQENSDCLIFRIPQLIGAGGNNNNLFNFLKTAILNKREIKTNNNVERALLDIEDLLKFVEYCKNESGVVNLAYIEKIKVVNMCEIIGNVVGNEPRITIDESMKSDKFMENSPIINKAIKELNVEMLGYNERLIKKYI